MLLTTEDRQRTTAEQAERFAQEWTAALPARLHWLRSVVPQALAPAGLTELDGLAEHVAAQRTAPGPADPPAWWSPDHEDRFSAHGAALADGLMAAVDDLVRARRGLTWRVDDDVRSAYYRRPVLPPLPTPPWTMVLTGLARAGLGRPPGLRGFVEHSLEVAGAAAARPAGEPEAVFAEVSDAGSGPWQFRVGLSEGASESLPPQVYADFEDLLRAVPGVVDAAGEDREEFLVRTDGRLRAQALEDAVNEQLTQYGPQG